jgi:hypothetical protein
MSDFERFVVEANIKRFQQLLERAADDEQKRLLDYLLSKEFARWRGAAGWDGAATANLIAAAAPGRPEDPPA